MAGVLLDEIKPRSSDSGKDNVKVVKRDIRCRLDDGVTRNGGARGVDFGAKVAVNDNFNAVLVAGSGLVADASGGTG